MVISTPVLPNRAPIAQFAFTFPHWANTTPFTYQDGLTNAKLVESIIAYVDKTLVPYIDEEMQKVVDAWQVNMLEMAELVDTAVADILLLAETLASEVNARLAENENMVDTRLTENEAYLNQLREDVIADSIQLQDPVIAGIVDDPTSQGSQAIDRKLPYVYGLKHAPGMAIGDMTAYLQQVVNEIATAGGGTMWMPPKATQGEIILKRNVSIEGAAWGASSLSAVPGSTKRGVITMDQAGGPVTRCRISNLTINGVPENTTQWGIYFRGVMGSNDGGLWYAPFNHLRINNTLGGGIWLRGGGDNNKMPQQFLSLNDVFIQVTAGEAPDWVGLRISGQVGQVTFNTLECSFRGTGKGLAGVFISREVDDAGAYISDRYAYALTFNAATFQGCVHGARVDRAQGVQFNSPWFEDNFNGISASNGAKGVVLIAPNFANTGANGSGTGYVAAANGSGSLTIIAPIVTGAYDRSWVDSTGSGNLTVIAAENGSQNIVNIPKAFNTAATIDIGASTYIALAGTVTVDNFTSVMDPQGFLTVQTQTAVTISQAGNIRLGGGISGAITFGINDRLVFKYDKAARVFLLIGGTYKQKWGSSFEIVNTTDGTGFFGLPIQTATPAAPVSGARLYTRIAGSKNQLVALFPTGGPIVIATEA